MRLAFCLLLIVFLSCNTHRHIRTIKQANTYYENSDYQFSYSMPSDYRSADAAKVYRKEEGRIVIADFETTDPVFRHAIYLQKGAIADLPGQAVDLRLPNDSIFESVRFWVIDSLPHLAVRFSSGANQFELRAVGNRGEAGSLLNEYEPIIGSIKVGPDYVDSTLLMDPHTLVGPYAYNSDSSTNYLQPVLILERAEQNYATKADRFSYIQALATYESRISNGASQYLDEFYRTGYFNRPKDLVIDCTTSLLETVKSIDRTIGDNRVVLINENHLDPRGRMLLQLLLPSLKEKGFTAIGFEGLWESGDSLLARGFALSTSGFYTKDPGFSNLLRTSIAQGFRVFGYDHFEANRELNQAQNIKDFLDRSGTEKLVVLAGFGHIHEGGTQRRMMASLLDSLLDMNPLTIDQVELVQSCLDSPLSLAIAPPDAGNAIQVDAYVSNHLTDEDLYDLRPVNFSLREVPPNAYPVAVEVYEASEAVHAKAVPVKVVRVERAADVVAFSIWRGDYLVRVKNRYGDELTSDTLLIL